MIQRRACKTALLELWVLDFGCLLGRSQAWWVGTFSIFSGACLGSFSVSSSGFYFQSVYIPNSSLVSLSTLRFSLSQTFMLILRKAAAVSLYHGGMLASGCYDGTVLRSSHLSTVGGGPLSIGGSER
jgi:hypothetical protein